jgi:2,3-dimethylmalate lyase
MERRAARAETDGSMHRNSKSRRLRELIGGPAPLILPYGACALHARLAERLGYDAIALSGGWATNYLLGRPDASFISLAEIAMLARYMAMAVEIPVIADCDQGFGNAINTYFTTEMMINAGCAGLHIEDQPLPKRCGFVDGKEVISIDEMVGKLRAARDAKMRLDPDFVIIARVDALTAVGGGFEEAVRRARAYREEGQADIIYMEGPRSVDEIRAIRDAVDGPLFCSLIAMVPHPSVDELRGLGQCVVQLVDLMLEPALIAAWESLDRFRREGMVGWNRHMDATVNHPMARLRYFDLVDTRAIRLMEERYLPKRELAKYTTTTGVYRMDGS